MSTPLAERSLPYYKRYSAFKKYMPFLKRFLEQGSFEHKPEQSYETFSSRFNYAVKSALQFGYDHKDLPASMPLHTVQLPTCVMRTGCVLIGTREYFKQWDKDHPEYRLTPERKSSLTINDPHISKVTQPEYLIKKDLSDRRLELIMELVSTKAWSPMPLFKVELDDKELMQQFEDRYDIVFDETEKEGVYRIL